MFQGGKLIKKMPLNWLTRFWLRIHAEPCSDSLYAYRSRLPLNSFYFVIAAPAAKWAQVRVRGNFNFGVAEAKSSHLAASLLDRGAQG